MYDIIIIGGGMAGLTAALYAQRSEKKVLIIERETIGGQIANSPRVENYPTIDAISGSELANRLFEQVMSHGADFELENVLSAEKKGEQHFLVTTDYATHEGKSIILATGVKHRTLGLPREEELAGSGVSYCAVCDGPFFKGEEVGVVGGGNSALQYAISLAGYCTRVHVLILGEKFSGDEALVHALQRLDNVVVHRHVRTTALLGEDSLSGVRLATPDGEQELPLKGLFVAIGQIPDNAPFAPLAGLDKAGYFEADESCYTQTPGVYVAGDCRTKRVRQLTTAAADGATAALAAIHYVA